MAEEQNLAPLPSKRRTAGRRLKIALAVVAVVAYVGFDALCGRYKIPTGNMEPSVLIGDHIVTLRLGRPWSGDAHWTLRRGDIVTFRSPADPSREFIKRVIGLPGETIRIEENRVFVDGAKLEEPYVSFSRSTGEISYDGHGNLPEIEIPDRQYFVLGDNRANSYDSRYWGFLPSELVTGRALFVYWSYDPPPYAEYSSGRERVYAILRVVSQFAARTRWDRFFHNLSAR